MSKAAPAKVATAAPSIAAHARDKNIDLALSAITKQFGEGSIMRLGSNQKMKVETLSTGSLAIDLALGVGGLPKGRIIEIQLAPAFHTWATASYDWSKVWRN